MSYTVSGNTIRKDGQSVPIFDAIDRLNHLEATLEVLARRMEKHWGWRDQGGWKFPDTFVVSGREACAVNDIVDVIFKHDAEAPQVSP